MNYYNCSIVLQEIPGEVTLAILITGCPNNCAGCHSEFAKDPNSGIKLTEEFLVSQIDKYSNLVTCILFEGGEWYPEEISVFLDIIQAKGVKTALYTGLDSIDDNIVLKLDYLKTGEYIEELGGLSSIRTNQKLVDLINNKDITYKFWRK